MKKLLYMLIILVLMILYTACSDSYEVAQSDDNIVIRLTGNNEIVLRKIAAGRFKMGTYEGFGEGDELPVRDITITKDFYIGECEITQKQWQAVMGKNPSGFKGGNLPVETMSWTECMEFCEKLSKSTGLSVTLPTEAQWEYACRAGSETKWFFGDTEEDFGKYASTDIDGKTLEVRSFEPNPNGLYDMYGNVMEWCLDYYCAKYPENDTVDPMGESDGEAKVSRGGGWGAIPDEARSAYRNACGADEKSDGIGLRIVINK